METTYDSKNYLENLETVTQQDVAALKKAEKNYGDSWKKRGGVGAYMMLARKIDRLENFLSKSEPKYDILTAVIVDRRPEGVIDDIRDLRRYLILVEAEMMALGAVIPEIVKDAPVTTPRKTEQEHPFGYNPKDHD